MTKLENDLEKFGKHTLAQLRPTPPIDPQVLEVEKAKFLLQGEKLRTSPIPSHTEARLKQTGRNRTFLGILSLPLNKTLAIVFLVFAFVIASSVSVAAAQSSLPGDTLYNLKAASEDIRLSFTFSPQQKLNLTLEYTERRLVEIQRLAKKGKTLPDQVSVRYQQELEDVLQLAALMNDQQIQPALIDIKDQAEMQGMNLEELIAQLPIQASPAMIRLQERLNEQVQLSTLGEKNPQEFRSQVREKAKNRQGPKYEPTSEQPESLPLAGTMTPLTPSDTGNGNGINKPTQVPGHGNPGNGQGQNNPQNGFGNPESTQIP
jgi:Domain of unknown function (DUF5667)